MSTSTERQDARNYMKENLHDHIDRVCNEVNSTSLAEDAASELDLYEDDGITIPEWVYDMATGIAIQWENEHKSEYGDPKKKDNDPDDDENDIELAWY